MIRPGTGVYLEVINARMKNSNMKGSLRCQVKWKKQGAEQGREYTAFANERGRNSNVYLHVLCLHKKMLMHKKLMQTLPMGLRRRWIEDIRFLSHFVS